MTQSRFVRFASVAMLLTGLVPLQAHAINKDMVQLQTQIQQLQDAIARLQQSNDERMGVLKDLVQQSTDTINKMSVAVNGLELRMQNQQDAAAKNTEQLSGQVQALNDSLDELKARFGRMEKTLGDVQGQIQTTNGTLANMPAPAGSAIPSSQPAPANASEAPGDNATASAAPTGQPQASSGPSPQALYRTAYSDYMAGNYPLATSEFGDLIKAFPDDNLSGNGYFYMGEIAVKNNKPSIAVKNYDRVIEHYPDNAKIPAAHLHKGEALIALKQRDDGIREYRALIQRFPNSPEAAQARTKLTAINGASVRR